MIATELGDLSDAELMGMVQEGSAPAFDELTDRYYTPLWRYFYHRTGHRQHAEDLAQQTLLDAYRKNQTITGGRTFASWLFKAAQLNLAMAHRQARVRKILSLDALLQKVGDSIRELQGPDSIASLPDRDLVDRVLAEIEPTLREPLLLQYVFGLRGQEIAEHLGIQPTTVRKRISRAKKRFRDLYREMDGDHTNGP